MHHAEGPKLRRCIIPTEVRPRTTEGIQLARDFAIDAARLASETRGHNIAVLDVSGLSPVTDFYVIITGTSARQMRAVADEIVDFGKTRGFRPLHATGQESSTWILADCIDVVIHVFTQESRAFYDLDGLWADAPRVEWELPKVPA